MNTRPLPRKLKKQPLVDAIFEIRFTSVIPASNYLPGVLFLHIGEQSRQIEYLPIAEIPAQIRNSDPNLRFQPILRLHWGEFLLQVGDTSLSINCKIPYPGWSAFKEMIVKVMSILEDAALIKTVERYSLKYINIIEGNTLTEPVKGISLDLRVGDHTLKSNPFSVRLEIPQDDLIQIVQVAAPVQVTLIDNIVREGIIVDIDTIYNCSISTISMVLNKLPVRVEELHSASKATFFGCLTDEALTHLEPIYE